MVEPDNEPLQKMGDPSVEVTDDNRDASHSAKAKAMDAISEASVYIKMKKPNAAIRDANAALEIRKDVKGSLFVVKRNTQPRFQFIVMNRRNTDNLVENLLGDFEYEVQDKYLLYHNASQEKMVFGSMMHMNSRRLRIFLAGFLLHTQRCPRSQRQHQQKVTILITNAIEELEAVSTMAIIDGPLEPSSSTAPSAADIPDDPAFVNFFSVCIFLFNFCPLITCNTFQYI
ncbi:hypothetical protein E1A91_D07G170600v1 [Gossypium mustelinum]|uniref:Uncharacterized protein n=1 Tax=Gossypium mustelinum TaxID=34275 RepID=A0A5D2UB92_GOSMU|nr:hypothetical protein E1A91_D07G170600v1 [Gossypium mustelinum]